MRELAAQAESYAALLVGYLLQRHTEGLLYAFHAQGHARGLGDELEARSLNNLGIVQDSLGNSEEAEKLHKRALEIREKTLGPDHPDVAVSLVGLAETCQKQKRFAEALPLMERARAIREKGKVKPKERAEAAFAFARMLWAIGKDRARARLLAQEALELYRAAGLGNEKDQQEVERLIAEHR